MLKKLKYCNIILAIAIVMVTVLTPNLISKAAEAPEFKINYGTSTISGTLLEHFSKSEIDPEKLWSQGFVELEDGYILYEGTNIADAYSISIPNASKDIYSKAKYIGFEIKNAGDGNVYYCFQCVTDDKDAFMSPSGETEIMLVDKRGTKYDIVFSDSPSVFSRYAIIIPEGFDGYVLIPTDRVTALNDWDNSVWSESMNLKGVGAHVSLGENSTPEVDSSYIEFYIDNFFAFNGEFPAYVAPEPTAEPIQTATPTPTATPAKTAEPTITKTPEKTIAKEATVTDDDFPVVTVVIISAVVVLAIVIVLVIIKRKKK